MLGRCPWRPEEGGKGRELQIGIKVIAS